MKFINLTPHSIRVRGRTLDHAESWAEFPPSGQVARVAVRREKTGGQIVNGTIVPLYRVTRAEVTGLPETVEGVTLIVSLVVREACPNRKDLVSPGELIRDETGQPVGCDGLTEN